MKKKSLATLLLLCTLALCAGAQTKYRTPHVNVGFMAHYTNQNTGHSGTGFTLRILPEFSPSLALRLNGGINSGSPNGIDRFAFGTAGLQYTTPINIYLLADAGLSLAAGSDPNKPIGMYLNAGFGFRHTFNKVHTVFAEASLATVVGVHNAYLGLGYVYYFKL